MKVIHLNKFYLIHDGSRSGHPGLCVWKDDEANLYLLIKFGSSKNHENIQLKHPISSGILASFVYKRPFLGKRKNVGREMDFNIGINKKDHKTLMMVSQTHPKYSRTLSNKDKHRFKWRYKKPSN